eukprot:5737933-Prymnesium_polylepis.2
MALSYLPRRALLADRAAPRGVGVLADATPEFGQGRRWLHAHGQQCELSGPSLCKQHQINDRLAGGPPARARETSDKALRLERGEAQPLRRPQPIRGEVVRGVAAPTLAAASQPGRLPDPTARHLGPAAAAQVAQDHGGARDPVRADASHQQQGQTRHLS